MLGVGTSQLLFALKPLIGDILSGAGARPICGALRRRALRDDCRVSFSSSRGAALECRQRSLTINQGMHMNRASIVNRLFIKPCTVEEVTGAHPAATVANSNVPIGGRTFAGMLAVVAVGLAGGCSRSESEVEKYLGTWNYDQPDLATLNNIDVLACPDGGGQCDPELPLPLNVPQIGWVVFSLAPDGTVNGRTDQGCLWNFDVTPAALELSSMTQSCFNKNIGSAGTLTHWSVTVAGDKEHESIVAVSHQPNGVDIIGTMNSGSRTRVTSADNDQWRFLGDWTYDPANFHTLVNVAATDKGTAIPQQGTVSIASAGKGKIVARTPEGCEWTLAVQGNTAELDPDMQTCSVADGSEVSLRYWALTTDDGAHLNTFRSGVTDVTGQTTNVALYVGMLTKAAP
jgi:hypothetical protein